ncbi:MAG: hypothetical protein GTO46_03835 [Gemmatimonadetes bacterium]|nr:hypothetical protein [Gemmatimonadota bacterium]NIO32931.1 hypothetical protein [Gemmatimonadota bacterium]
MELLEGSPGSGVPRWGRRTAAVLEVVAVLVEHRENAAVFGNSAIHD